MHISESRTILLVEDEALLAVQQKAILNNCGFSVICVASGEKAVDAVDANPTIEMILMDINLGRGMDGTEAARIILERHDIPLVFLSSHTEPEIVEKTEGITSYGYIVKHAGETVLLASIRMAFRLHESRMNERKAGEALAENECRLRTLSDNLPGGMVYQILSDPQGGSRRFTYLSAGVETLHGITADEAMEDAGLVYTQVHKDDLPILQEKEIAAAVAMSLFRTETRIVLPSGETRWRFFSSAPRRLPDGDILWDGIEIDITERKQAEQARRNEEDRYRRLVEGLGDRACVFSHTPEGVFTHASPGFGRLFGIDHKEVIGRNWRDLPLTSESLCIGETTDMRILAEQSTETVELTVIHPDGSNRIIEVVYGPVFSGTHIVALEGVCTDITERRRCEEALREEETWYRRAIEQSHDGIMVTDEQGLVVVWNASIERITGITAAQAVGRPIAELQFSLAPPEIRTAELIDKIKEYVNRMLAPDEAAPSRIWRQAIVAADGMRKTVEESTFQVRSTAGARYGSILRVVD